ncbi:G-protein coupled receptor 20 [Tupaia chinensis]|uniref:G-protein coupled receptor 20 n=1 Tax=Tupaia chinensis TaxID=246437 RepID=UPI0003C92295|nr:G-protein coupled receptor 20 [Tupaia chinensis]
MAAHELSPREQGAALPEGSPLPTGPNLPPAPLGGVGAGKQLAPPPPHAFAQKEPECSLTSGQEGLSQHRGAAQLGSAGLPQHRSGRLPTSGRPGGQRHGAAGPNHAEQATGEVGLLQDSPRLPQWAPYLKGQQAQGMLAAVMSSRSPTGSSATAAPNITAAPGATAGEAWANSSTPEKPLFHLFALLDEELHAAYPGLWLALMAVHGAIFLAGLVLNGLALYVFCCRTRAPTPSVTYTINLAVTDLLVGLSLPTRFAVFYGAPGCLRCAFPHVLGYFLNMHCSVLFLTCICVDRYLAIVQPEGSVALWPHLPHHASLVAYHVAVTLSSLNSCLDPIVYCFVTSGFQATVRGLFRRRGAESERGSGDALSVRKSSRGSGHQHISAGPGALAQALASGPQA